MSPFQALFSLNHSPFSQEIEQSNQQCSRNINSYKYSTRIFTGRLFFISHPRIPAAEWTSSHKIASHTHTCSPFIFYVNTNGPIWFQIIFSSTASSILLAHSLMPPQHPIWIHKMKGDNRADAVHLSVFVLVREICYECAPTAIEKSALTMGATQLRALWVGSVLAAKQIRIHKHMHESKSVRPRQ